MSKEDLISRISCQSAQYTTSVTGSFYVLKKPDYPPWEPYTDNPEGRYNGPCTGSLYLGDTLETCISEVGRTDKAAYQVDVDKINPGKIFDLAKWSIDNPSYSGSLLIHSASGGWEPTRKIGDWAYNEGYEGILFRSQYGNNWVNLLLYRNRVSIQEEFFTLVDL